MSTPRLGAVLGASGTTFRVWSPGAREVVVRVDASRGAPRTEALEPMGDGVFEVELAGVHAGARYTFVLDGRELPDPYARYLPLGVHGSAEVMAELSPRTKGVRHPLHELVIYELH